MAYRILAINPGSTSTKVALYEDEKRIFTRLVPLDEKELENKHNLFDQLPLHERAVQETLKANNVDVSSLNVIMARGGLLPPVKPGGYKVNDTMKDLIRSGELSPHPSNLAALIADDLAAPYGIPCYIYDAPSASNMPPIARVTGIPEITRESTCHVLNSRAVAHKVAQKEFGKKYGEMRFIVAHLGGGISFSSHMYGKIVDSAGDDDGAFSPERSGGLPLLDVLKLYDSGKYTYDEMRRKIRGQGGLRGHLGTADCREIEEMVWSGDEYAELLYKAQAYQIAKGIGLQAAAMKGQVDGIILTGGLAFSKMLTDWVSEYVSFVAPVFVYPGENEMESLALGGLRILRGEEKAREFKL
ncbi:MAG: butyrate kinase [Firmicutes bacterium]|nr:butyrate kinase [Bacillota bacterium]